MSTMDDVRKAMEIATNIGVLAGQRDEARREAERLRADLAAVEQERDRLREALEAVEWIEVPSGPGTVESVCAWCQGEYPKHRKDCDRQAAIAEPAP